MPQGIYKITNLINNHSYIGQSIDIERRFKQHIKDSKNKKTKKYNYHLYSAFRLYGTKNFKFEILELVPNKEDLTFKEKYYYDILDHAYNQTLPEKVNYHNQKKVFQWSLEGDFIKDYDSMSNASRETNLNTSSISYCANGFSKKAGNFIWTFEKVKPNFYEERYKFLFKKVYQYDLDGLFLNEYNSIKDAANKNNLKAANISNCCNERVFSTGGFMWSFKKEKIKPVGKDYVPHAKRVVQKDLKGNVLKIYESFKKAAFENNVSSKAIRDAANKIQKTSAGFIWDYYIEGGQ